VSALDRVDGMHAVLGLFEGVLTGAADGYGRMTGKPAAPLLHLGPGLANDLANLHSARKAATPVVNSIGDHGTTRQRVTAPLADGGEGCGIIAISWIPRPLRNRVRAIICLWPRASIGLNAVSIIRMKLVSPVAWLAILLADIPVIHETKPELSIETWTNRCSRQRITRQGDGDVAGHGEIAGAGGGHGYLNGRRARRDVDGDGMVMEIDVVATAPRTIANIITSVQWSTAEASMSPPPILHSWTFECSKIFGIRFGVP